MTFRPHTGQRTYCWDLLLWCYGHLMTNQGNWKETLAVVAAQRCKRANVPGWNWKKFLRGGNWADLEGWMELKTGRNSSPAEQRGMQLSFSRQWCPHPDKNSWSAAHGYGSMTRMESCPWSTRHSTAGGSLSSRAHERSLVPLSCKSKEQKPMNFSLIERRKLKPLAKYKSRCCGPTSTVIWRGHPECLPAAPFTWFAKHVYDSASTANSPGRQSK